MKRPMFTYPRSVAFGFVVAFGVGLVACDDAQLPTTVPPPPPLPPTQPGPGLTLSGVVYEHTLNGPIPRPNVRLRVRVYASNAFIEVTSDASGRYSLSGVAPGPVSIAAALGSGYYAPCPAGSGIFPTEREFDVHVVSASLLSTTGMPNNMMPFAAIWVSGTVYEKTADGKRQPIAGATVNLDGDVSDPRLGSTTLSGAAGNYRLCPPIPSSGTDTYGSIWVSREGYLVATSRAFLGWDYDGVDIELVRN